MKQYVPNLIPRQHRVLTDYFQEPQQGKPGPRAAPVDILWWVVAGVATLAALTVLLQHAGFSLCLLILAFLASPWGRHRLEQQLQFRFTPLLKGGAMGVMILACLLTGQQYQDRMAQQAEAGRLAVLAQKKAQVAAQRQEQLRRDSLQWYLVKAESALRQKTYAKATRLFNQSLRLAQPQEESEKRRAWTGLATACFNTRQYQEALDHYDQLLSISPSQTDYLYRQALCYHRMGRTKEAITNLAPAAEAGYAPASKLYNKLNPLLRKLLYYQTVCCDGSYSPSNAKGSGACSHHGGVCNWNKPIYETYRKYDVNGL